MNEQRNKDQNEKAPHVLNASSNLLGICFVVLTSLKILNISKTTVIDEITTVAIIAFMASCLLSFLAIKNGNSNSYKLEQIADYIFIAGIGLLFVTTILFTFDVIA